MRFYSMDSGVSSYLINSIKLLRGLLGGCLAKQVKAKNSNSKHRTIRSHQLQRKPPPSQIVLHAFEQ